MRTAAYLIAALGIGSSAWADEATWLTHDPLWPYVHSALKQCAEQFAPELVVDIDSGHMFDGHIEDKSRFGKDFQSCAKETGWGRSGWDMSGGGGKRLICFGGFYHGIEPASAARIREECVHACARYGYVQEIYDAPPKLEPKDPDDDVKEFMPPQCMP